MDTIFGQKIRMIVKKFISHFILLNGLKVWRLYPTDNFNLNPWTQNSILKLYISKAFNHNIYLSINSIRKNVTQHIMETSAKGGGGGVGGVKVSHGSQSYIKAIDLEKSQKDSILDGSASRLEGG